MATISRSCVLTLLHTINNIQLAIDYIRNSLVQKSNKSYGHVHTRTQPVRCIAKIFRRKDFIIAWLVNKFGQGKVVDSKFVDFD